MDKEKTSLERITLLATSVLGAIGALFAAINSLSDSVRTTLRIFSGFQNWQLGIAALVLVAFSLWLLHLSRRRRSVLLRPDALRLERADPAHLVGRADDIQQLIRLCREQPLVFLEGESGCGKSALLQAGLVPFLKNDPELLPIYVESLVGSNWERDPRRFVAAALWSALDESARATLEPTTVPGADAVRGIIEAVQAKLGRTPLIILDQFDDYQNRHRDRFLSRKTWLKPARLADQNGFWRDVRKLLAGNTIRLIDVTRTDTAAGLTSVRFIEPETYRLDRLSSPFVGPLVAEMTSDRDGQKAVSDPGHGWTLLLSRLSADLDHSGTILPQQLKIVLAGLVTLPGRVLTIASYERAGAAAGLEARFIENAIAKAARLHGVAEERVRTTLVALIDPVDGQKTIERPVQQLLSSIDPAAPDKAQPVLDLLSQEEVIRRRVNPDTGEISWLLDHDYLAHAVREADRRANRWQRVLAEGANAVADAGDSWARWWRALLPPKTQLAFLWDRVRGRFRYGEHRGYATKSLPRLGPYVAIFLALVGVGAYEKHRRSEQAIQVVADSVLNSLDFTSGRVSEEEVQTLLFLASADEAVRRRVLTLIITDPTRAWVFIRRPDTLIRALAGVSPSFVELAKHILVDVTNKFDSNQVLTARAIADAAYFLGKQNAVPMAWWTAAIQVVADPYALWALGAGIGAVVASDSQAQEAIVAFLAAIKGTNNPYALWALGMGLGAVRAKLSDSQAQEAIVAFLAAIKGTNNPYALWALGMGLGAVPAELSDSQAKEVVEPFLAVIKGSNDSGDLLVLGEGVKAIVAKLRDSQAKEMVDQLLAAIKDTNNKYALPGLTSSLIAVAAKLRDSQAREAVEPFLAAIKGTNNPDALRALADGLKFIPAKLSDSQAEEAVEAFLAAIKGTNSQDALYALGNDDLGSGLEAIIAKLSDSQAKEAVDRLLTAIKRTNNPYALWALGMGLGAVRAELSEALAPEAVDRLLAAIKGTNNPDALRVLADGLKFIPAKLSDSQAEEAVGLFLAVIKGTNNPVLLHSLSLSLEEVMPKLSDSQAREAVEPFLAAIKGTNNPDALRALGTGLEAVAAKLDLTSVKAVNLVVNRVLDRARDEETFAIYAELSAHGDLLAAKLMHNDFSDQQIVRIFYLLSHPLSAGKTTEKLLALLQQLPGVNEKFDGDLWKAVEWVQAEQKQGQLKDLDLNARLRVPQEAISGE